MALVGARGRAGHARISQERSNFEQDDCSKKSFSKAKKPLCGGLFSYMDTGAMSWTVSSTKRQNFSR